MTKTPLTGSLPELRQRYRATIERLEAAAPDARAEKRALYQELKELQYAICMKEATEAALAPTQ